MKKPSSKKPSSDFKKLIEMYKKIHKEGAKLNNKIKKTPEETYNGESTLFFADFLKKFIMKNNCKTLLDYGSGKGDCYFNEKKFGTKNIPPLKDYWNIIPELYDPAVDNLKKPLNKKYDIVISVDVLEHIPRQDLFWVINEIFSLSKKIVFLNIACYPAEALLEDGRNAHVSIFDPMWWCGFITAIAHNYELKIIATCSYFNKDKKLNYTTFGINDNFQNYP